MEGNFKKIRAGKTTISCRYVHFTSRPQFDGNTHFVTYLCQFEVTLRLTKLSVEEKVLRRPVGELLHKVAYYMTPKTTTD